MEETKSFECFYAKSNDIVNSNFHWWTEIPMRSTEVVLLKRGLDFY